MGTEKDTGRPGDGAHDGTYHDVARPKPEYPFHHTRTFKDPYSKGHLFYTLAANIGYPLELHEATENLPHMFDVMVDSSETSRKLKELRVFLQQAMFTRTVIVTAVDVGFNTHIDYIKTNNIKALQQFSPETQEIERIDDHVLDRCWIVAFRRMKERETWKEETHLTYRAQIDPGEENRYRNLLKRGIRPIEPEALGGLLMVDLRRIIDQHPELDFPKSSTKNDDL